MAPPLAQPPVAQTEHRATSPRASLRAPSRRRRRGSWWRAPRAAPRALSA
jgi:hypothetical protein